MLGVCSPLLSTYIFQFSCSYSIGHITVVYTYQTWFMTSMSSHVPSCVSCVSCVSCAIMCIVCICKSVIILCFCIIYLVVYSSAQYSVHLIFLVNDGLSVLHAYMHSPTWISAFALALPFFFTLIIIVMLLCVLFVHSRYATTRIAIRKTGMKMKCNTSV